jgi:hypothetical protein
MLNEMIQKVVLPFHAERAKKKSLGIEGGRKLGEVDVGGGGCVGVGLPLKGTIKPLCDPFCLLNCVKKALLL